MSLLLLHLRMHKSRPCANRADHIIMCVPLSLLCFISAVGWQLQTLALLHLLQSHCTALQMSETLEDLFLEACKGGDVAKVNSAIVLGVDINIKDADGWTGLLWAIVNKQENIVDILLAHPAIDINGRGSSGCFPLPLAALHGLASVVARLGGTQAAVRGVNDQYAGWTPLILATRNGKGISDDQFHCNALSDRLKAIIIVKKEKCECQIIFRSLEHGWRASKVARHQDQCS